MLVLGHFLVFLPVIIAEFRIAVLHRVGSFNKVIAKGSVAGFNAFRILCVERTGLMLTPDETGVFGNSGLVLKSSNVADLRENAGGVHGTDARDRLQ